MLLFERSRWLFERILQCDALYSDWFQFYFCFFLRFRSFAASKYAYIKEFSMKVDKILFEDF